MKRILATTAIVALVATPVFAESHMSGEAKAEQAQAQQMPVTMGESEFSLSEVIGARVYISETGEKSEWTEAEIAEPDGSWEDVGEVGDVYMTEIGGPARVIVDVGGFLGIGEHEVALTEDELSVVRDADDEGTLFVVFHGPRSALEERETFDSAAAQDAGEMSGRSTLETAQANQSEMGQSNSNGNSNDLTAMVQSDTQADAQSDSQQSMQAGTDFSAEMDGRTIRASELLDKTVYVRSDAAADAEIAENASEPSVDWESIGEIGDVVLTADGGIESIVIDAGGFLGVGEKHLTTQMDELRFVADDSAADDYFIVFTGNRAALEDREELDRQAVLDTGGSFFADNSGTYQQAEGVNTAAEQPAINETGRGMPALTGDERAALTADDLQGLAVYDVNNDHVGEISELVLDESGKITNVVIDVGGFLGIGEKPVAVAFQDIQLSHEEGDSETGLYATTNATYEQLEAMEEWNN